MDSAGEVSGRVRWATGASAVMGALSAVTRDASAWTFAGIYALATVVLVVTGHADLLGFQVGIDAVLAVLCVATIAATPPDTPLERGTPPRRRATFQLALVTAYTLYVAVFVNGGAALPPLNAINRAAGGLPFFARNPLLYFALPALALLAAGVRLRRMGLAPGRNVVLVALMWSVVPVDVIALRLAAGAERPLGVVATLVDGILQNGFFEEFLWRGAILTRLRAVAGSGWAITLSSLGFGLWHLASDTSRLGGNLAAGLAYCVICQATVGVGFAVAFVRTRNLVVPSVAHVLFNVA